MAAPIIGAIARSGGTAVKGASKKLRTITSENKLAEMSNFVNDYSTQKLEQLRKAGEKGKLFGQKAKETFKTVSKDLLNVVEPSNIEVETDEVAEKMKSQVKKAQPKATKPIGSKGHFETLKKAIQSMPTPKGVAFLLIIILIILFAIRPAKPDGTTRLQLAWRTIIGRTYIHEYQKPEEEEAEAVNEFSIFSNMPIFSGVNLVSGVANVIEGVGDIGR